MKHCALGTACPGNVHRTRRTYRPKSRLWSQEQAKDRTDTSDLLGPGPRCAAG